ncbi:unnamed protein product [Darwinula stevensoni]|uniref:Solute carrier family 12 member 9 n=1 Tax=Darwinula stevensoni TaxID=69355 RepID=A0A7R8X8B5_9CRUS|nr:unnamed protein product [Darwinula stevensoni]CAG0889505.1 unnamed protein product [Darwinula stevensoni]
MSAAVPPSNCEERNEGCSKMSQVTPKFQVTVVKAEDDFQPEEPTQFRSDQFLAPPNYAYDYTKSATPSHASRYLRSLTQLTRDALPREHHYWSTRDIQGEYRRPSLDDLHAPAIVEPPRTVPEERRQEDPQEGVIKFGWIKGVFIKCLLNIWGVMLFLRLSWVVGQAGIGQGLILISSCNLVTLVTSISMSAVSTNGQIKGGGIYYMISRSLGPQFGGAIGLMFTFANSIACAMYIIGFCDSLKALLANEFSTSLIGGGENFTRVFGCISIVVIFIIVFVGMNWVTRTEFLLLGILLASQADFIIGTIMGPTDDKNLARGFVGYRRDVFKQNWQSAYGPSGVERKDQNFFSVFAIFFPAVTGIVAGANLSGDLKDPSSAIPKGTLAAMILTYFSYIGYAVMMAGCEVRDASGDISELDKNLADILDSPAFNCTSRSCNWGLKNSNQMMTTAAAWYPLIYGGCFAATLSSAIGSLIGAPRALARDKLYPGIGFFGVGSGPNNDPVRGYVACFIIAVACILLGQFL